MQAYMFRPRVWERLGSGGLGKSLPHFPRVPPELEHVPTVDTWQLSGFQGINSVHPSCLAMPDLPSFPSCMALNEASKLSKAEMRACEMMCFLGHL